MEAQSNNIAEQIIHQHETKSMLSSKISFSKDIRGQFYSGEDRVSLPKNELDRVYTLEKENDLLQREIHHRQQQVHSVSNPFTLLDEIEQSRMTISRNIGEVLRIFDLSKIRAERIVELEKLNAAMHQENKERIAVWASTHNMEERTHLANKTFLNNELIMKNELEINNLKKEAA